MSDEQGTETAEGSDDEIVEDVPEESTDSEETNDADASEDVEESEDAADVEEDAESDESEADEDVDGLQDGDFVRLDYTIRTVEEGTVVDTTREDVAEEAGIADEDYDFSPRTIVIGAGHVFQAVDDDLIGKDDGDTGTVEISAVEAFGEFDPDDVRTVSAEKIDEQSRYPGARVTVDGRQGYIETVVGGRARVDFNHPLAGDDLEYEYEIVGVVDDPEEQAKGLLGMYLQQAPEVWIQTDEVEEEVEVEADDDSESEAAGEDGEDGDDDEDESEPEPETEVQTVEKRSLYIEATPGMAMNQQWLFSKQQIAQDLMDRLDLDRVIVQETIEGPGGMGMMGGMGGLGGMGGAGDIEDAIEDVDVDPEEIIDELEDADLDLGDVEE